MTKIRRTQILASACLVATTPALAQNGDTPGDTRYSDIVEVTAPRLSRNLYDTPAAVSLVDAGDELRIQEALQLDEALQLVPGFYFQNRYNFAQNLRISARGFGSRAPFGVRGLQLQVDGIPYTLPDGQSQVDSIDLDAADTIQVIRGPAAVQYGNGAGGVIDIQTRDGDNEPALSVGLDTGSHDFYKLSAQASGANEHGSAHLSLSRLGFQGYREQSEVDKRLLHGKFRWNLDDDRSLTAITTLLDLPTAQDPGGLTAAQAGADRRQASFMANRLDAGQTVEQQTLGLVYRDESLPHGHWSASLFGTRRDFFQQLPFPGSSQIAYDRWFYGGGVEITQDWSEAGIPVRYSAGIDLHRQQDDRERYLVSAQGQVTGQSADEMQEATTTGLFVQSDWLVSDTLTLSVGGRYDRLKMSIDDKLGLSEVGSGERRLEELSGSLGFSYRWHRDHQLYGNIATAYESPTFTEFANPVGSGFNPDLEAQSALSRELGIRGNWRNLGYDVALFSTRVKDEIVPYEIAGRTFYENAGKTDRDGLEVAVLWQLNDHWRLRSALTLAEYQFREFNTQSGERVNGNDMPGLPRQQWVNQLRWQQGRWHVEIDGTYTGDYYAENSNTTKVDSVLLVDARAGIRLGEDISLYTGIRNLTDQDYFGNVRINANSDRPVASRGYFEPAPGRTFYLGVGVRF